MFLKMIAKLGLNDCFWTNQIESLKGGRRTPYKNYIDKFNIIKICNIKTYVNVYIFIAYICSFISNITF